MMFHHSEISKSHQSRGSSRVPSRVRPRRIHNAVEESSFGSSRVPPRKPSRGRSERPAPTLPVQGHSVSHGHGETSARLKSLQSAQAPAANWSHGQVYKNQKQNKNVPKIQKQNKNKKKKKKKKKISKKKKKKKKKKK